VEIEVTGDDACYTGSSAVDATVADLDATGLRAVREARMMAAAARRERDTR